MGWFEPADRLRERRAKKQELVASSQAEQQRNLTALCSTVAEIMWEFRDKALQVIPDDGWYVKTESPLAFALLCGTRVPPTPELK